MKAPLFLYCLLFLGLLHIYCSQSDSQKVNQNAATTPLLDTSDFAILSFDQKHDWPFQHTFKPAPLNQKEVHQIDSLLRRCVSDYNKKLATNLRAGYSIDFEKYKYKRQYMAVVNSKGEKEVWINCFCNTWEKNWKNEIILVHDGGNCYFNLKINLTSGECFEVSVNGYA